MGSLLAAVSVHIDEVPGTRPHLRRYEDAENFGRSETAFNVWHVGLLAATGSRHKPPEKFEELLRTRNHPGLMSEDADPRNRETWGNFPQTCPVADVGNGAVRLSRRWETVV